MSNDKTKVMFGGITTQFDVKKLMERFETKPDDIVEHSDIAETIGVQWRTHRYAAVVNAWRATLRKERNVFLSAVPGVGFKVLTNVGKMKDSAADVVKGSRSLIRALVKLNSVEAEKLDETTRKTYDHQKRLTSGLSEEATRTRKTISVRLGEFEPSPRPRLRAVGEDGDK